MFYFFTFFITAVEKFCRYGVLWPSIKNTMSVISVVFGLFVLAIVSPWIFPNKMVSNNEHDKKH